MFKRSKRDEIIAVATEMFDRSGYNGVSVNEVLEAVNMPKSSFYYYFASKEDLVKQTIVHFMKRTLESIAAYPNTVEGLRGFFNEQFDHIISTEFRGGCTFGSLTSEMAGLNEEVRKDLIEISVYVETFVRRTLMNTMNFNRSRANEYSIFIMTAFQGAVIKGKIDRSDAPFRVFDRFIFDMLLLPTESRRREDRVK